MKQELLRMLLVRVATAVVKTTFRNGGNHGSSGTGSSSRVVGFGSLGVSGYQCNL